MNRSDADIHINKTFGFNSIQIMNINDLCSSVSFLKNWGNIRKIAIFE